MNFYWCTIVTPVLTDPDVYMICHVHVLSIILANSPLVSLNYVVGVACTCWHYYHFATSA
jgi:hypothetical protein